MFVLIAVMPLLVNAQTGLNRVYNEDLDPMAQIDEALGVAKADGKFVVCQVGGNWCPWCLRFADFITKDADISKLIAENYVYIHVNYNPRNKDAETKAKPLLRRLKNPQRFGFPVFVVLDAEGEVLHIQDSSFLEEGQGYSKDKVILFFKNWTPKAVKE